MWVCLLQVRELYVACHKGVPPFFSKWNPWWDQPNFQRTWVGQLRWDSHKIQLLLALFWAGIFLCFRARSQVLQIPIFPFTLASINLGRNKAERSNRTAQNWWCTTEMCFSSLSRFIHALYNYKPANSSQKKIQILEQSLIKTGTEQIGPGTTTFVRIKNLKQLWKLFFLYTLSKLVWELTHNAQWGGHETRGVGVGMTKQRGTETLGDLWKGEGWDGEHE